MKALLSLTLALFAGMASADCPPSPDISDAEAALLTAAQKARNAYEAQPIAGQLWMLWRTAPDEVAQELLDDGIRAREAFDFLRAEDKFDRLTAYCPDYAEGYNQRAFVSFLREDFDAALVDLELALDRRPTHVAALSGKALTLMGLGRHEEAQKTLRSAVRLNPWIPERGLLTQPPGEKL